MIRGGRGRFGLVTAVFALLITASIALAGCADPDAAADAAQRAQFNLSNDEDARIITVDGEDRSYVARVPESAVIGSPMPLPVLIVMHGAGGNSAKVEAASGLTRYAAANNFIAVYPNGTMAADIEGQLAWNAGDCCAAPLRNDVDDVAFIEAVLADLAAEYVVDESRVYIAGFSNGGMMSYRLACELGDRIAGVAVVAGALNVSDCESESRASVLIVHGTGDLTVPYDGGPTNSRTAARFGSWTNKSVADAAAAWATRDGCDPSPSRETSGSITLAVYDECQEDGALEVVTIEDGLHVWPISPVSGFDASSYLVEFFGLD
ncbi:MAG: lipoprotein [Microbacteriaceae bacterium]|nr:lipoprotein [Microbacteriaceae bacterium]